MRKAYLFLTYIYCFCFFALASAENKIVSTYPSDGQTISSLSQIEFEIDCSDTYTKYTSYTSEQIGLLLPFVEDDSYGRKLYFYKGDPNDGGTLLEKGETWVTGSLGNTSIVYNLSDKYDLEYGQKYTIYIPENCIWTYHDADKSRNRLDKTSPSITITIIGGKEEGALSCESTSPNDGDKVEELGVMTFNFSGDIKLASKAEASLYKISNKNTTLVKSVNLKMSESDANVAIADFEGETLYATETYNVTVPKEAILLYDDSETTLSQSISLTFAGGTYKKFGYSYVSPSSGTICSKIGTVTIVPTWPEEAAGFVSYSSTYYDKETEEPWSFYVKLYKGIDSTGVFVTKKKLELNNSCTALEARFNNPELEPNTTYALVIPEGTIPAFTGNSSYKPMEAYHSEPLTLLYTGANTASKWSIKENDQLEKLGLVSLMTGGEATVNDDAKMALYCGEDSIAAADINASGKFCYADFGDLALEKGADYSLVIPDSAIVNMSKTTQKFKGIAKPAEYATVSYKAGNTTIVADSVLVGSKVAFNVIDADTLALDSLTLNGASVELTDSAYVIDSIAANADLAAAIRYIPTPAEYIDITYKSAGTTLETKNVLKGTQLTFNVAECDTLKLDSLVLNGINVTDSIKSGAFTTDSLTENTVIEANMQYIPTPAPETKFYAVEYMVKSVVDSDEKELSSTSTKVAEDSVFTFKAKAVDENWSVEVSVGEMSEDSIYSIVVAKDTSVVVTYSFNGEVKYVDETASGVYTFENEQEITISTTQGKIVVEGAKAGDTINLYGLNGAKLGQWIVKQDKQTIDVNSGVYLVVVKGDAGKAAAKVSVK